MLLPKYLKPLLEKYLKIYKSSYWLFEGQNQWQYSVRSVQQIFRDVVLVSAVNTYATVYKYRRSFATHLLENGKDLQYI
jgi:integrase/recombinase XerD